MREACNWQDDCIYENEEKVLMHFRNVFLSFCLVEHELRYVEHYLRYDHTITQSNGHNFDDHGHGHDVVLISRIEDVHHFDDKASLAGWRAHENGDDQHDDIQNGIFEIVMRFLVVERVPHDVRWIRRLPYLPLGTHILIDQMLILPLVYKGLEILSE